MCGIAGVYLKAPAPDILKERMEPFVDQLYKGIEARGKHATGFVAVSKTGEVRIDKDAKTASKFIKDRERLPVDVQCVLLHTRYKTKGSEKDFRNNHPVIWKTCFTTHNGSINNDDRLFKKYELERHAEVDSEIIPALMHKSGFKLEEMKAVLDEMNGPMAMATINPTEYPGVLILAKTYTSPLFYLNTRQMVLWASEVDAMREAWAKVFGTPPEKSKFSEVHHRTLIVVENDRMHKHNIPMQYTSGGWSRPSDPPKDKDVAVRVVHSNGPKHPLQERLAIPSETYARKVETVQEAISSEQIKQRVEGLRANGDGEAVTIAEMRTLPYAAQFGPWRACEICAAVVQSDDLTSSVRGDICADCKTVWADMAGALRQEAVDTECDSKACDDAVADQRRETIYSMTRNTMRYVNAMKLNLFSSDEDFLHQSVLRQMADNLPLEIETLDYMLFRADTLEVEYHPVLSEMVPALMEIYEDIREELGEYLMVDESDFFEAFKDKESVDAPMESAKEVKLPQFRFAPAVCSSAKQRPDKCAFCRKHAKNSIERDEGKITYCAVHFDVCNTRGCKENAQYTRTDGIRVCHQHARGVKGCVHDSVLSQEGYLVGATEE